jgi:hypothetical protein
MDKEDPLRELFGSLIDDPTEKKVMDLIISDKEPDEIIDFLLNKDK